MAVSEGLVVGQKALAVVSEKPWQNLADGQEELLKTARKQRKIQEIGHQRNKDQYAEKETKIEGEIEQAKKSFKLNVQLQQQLQQLRLEQLNDQLEQARADHANYLVQWELT